MKLTPTLRSALITLTSFIFVITMVHAWTGPSVSAPDGNVSAPLTISSVSQSKTGGLDVGWLSAVGAIKVGYTATACTAELAGSLRWNTGVMEYCDGIDTWRSFGGGTFVPINNSEYATIGNLVWDKIDQGNKTYDDAMSYCSGRGMFLPAITDWDIAKGIEGGASQLKTRLGLGDNYYKTSSRYYENGAYVYLPTPGTWISNGYASDGIEANLSTPRPIRCVKYLTVSSVEGGGGGIGYGQTWQDMLGSSVGCADVRASGVLCTNSTPKPIMVNITTHSSNVTVYCYIGTGTNLMVGGAQRYQNGWGDSMGSLSFIVPPGETYHCDTPSAWVQAWAELR